MIRAFAELAGIHIESDLDKMFARDAAVARIKHVIEDNRIALVYQPIVRLWDSRIVGFECLSRIMAEPSRSPDKWFSEAAEVGMGAMLELSAVRLAVTELPAFPTDVYLSLNLSPAAILSGEIQQALADVQRNRLLLEITEHAAVDDYDRLMQVLAPLRATGLRIAIDDAGAGFSSMRHILALRPDIIKLDTVLIRGIDSDPAKRPLARALGAFAREINSQIVAEGVETETEFNTVKALGAENVQGYFIGRPVPFREAVHSLD